MTAIYVDTIIAVPSSLAQWQSGRLLTARFEVQVLGEELNDALMGVFYFASWKHVPSRK